LRRLKKNQNLGHFARALSQNVPLFFEKFEPKDFSKKSKTKKAPQNKGLAQGFAKLARHVLHKKAL